MVAQSAWGIVAGFVFLALIVAGVWWVAAKIYRLVFRRTEPSVGDSSVALASTLVLPEERRTRVEAAPALTQEPRRPWPKHPDPVTPSPGISAPAAAPTVTAATPARPPWYRLILLPPWFSYAVMFFAVTMLVVFPFAIATTSMTHRARSNAIGAYIIVLLFSVGYGVYSARRTRRTIIASDEYSYTIKIERLPRSSRAEQRDRS